MSDPLTSNDLEDVLSSIRRLVSEEKRPFQARSAPSPVGRLVLTPALRVTEGGDALEPSTGISREKAANRTTESCAREEDSSAAKLTAKIAALETAIGTIRAEFEPKAPGTDVCSGTEAPTMAWEDHVEPAASGQGQGPADPGSGTDTPHEAKSARSDAIAPVPQALADTPGRALSLDDPLIDEDMLRDLVSTIVREELQGALGERITRNVRKLVRREIHRALTAQELD